jgi:hypothetical protein
MVSLAKRLLHKYHSVNPFHWSALLTNKLGWLILGCLARGDPKPNALQVVNLSTLQYKGILSLSKVDTVRADFFKPRDEINVLVQFFSKIITVIHITPPPPFFSQINAKTKERESISSAAQPPSPSHMCFASTRFSKLTQKIKW